MALNIQYTQSGVRIRIHFVSKLNLNLGWSTDACLLAWLSFFLIKSAHPDFLKRLAAFFGWLYPYRLMAAKITVTFLIGWTVWPPRKSRSCSHRPGARWNFMWTRWFGPWNMNSRRWGVLWGCGLFRIWMFCGAKVQLQQFWSELPKINWSTIKNFGRWGSMDDLFRVKIS